MLEIFRVELDGLARPQDFLFSAATGWWYDSRPDATMEQLCRYLDAIVPMAYNSPEEPVGGTLERMQQRLPYATWDRLSGRDKRFIVGLGINEHDDLRPMADSLEDWLQSRFPGTHGGLAFFSSHDLLREFEKQNEKSPNQ
jgi:hypothetical protein